MRHYDRPGHGKGKLKHVVGVVMDWILSNGGINAMEALSIRKSQMVYDLIQESDGFFLLLLFLTNRRLFVVE